MQNDESMEEESALLELLPDDEDTELDASATTCKNRCTRRRAGFGFLAILATICVVLVLDLVCSNNTHSEIHSARINVREPLPRASVTFDFEYGASLSTVTPKSMTCQLPAPGGEITASVKTMNDEEGSHYQLDASFGEDSLDANIDLLWEIVLNAMNEERSSAEVDMRELACQIQVEVALFHAIPITISINVDATDLDMIRSEDSETPEANEEVDTEKTETEAAGETESDGSSGQKDQYSKRSREVNKEQAKEDSNVVFRQINAKTLQMAYRIELPQHIVDAMSSIEIVLPELEVDGKSSPIVDIQSVRSFDLRFEGLDANFFSRGDDNISSSEDHWAVFTVTCPSSDTCPWYGAVIEWYLKAQNAPDGTVPVDLNVNGNDSFLEAFLGPHHPLTVQWSQEKVLGLGGLGELRRDLVSDTTTYLKEASANCLGVEMEQAGTFGFQWCWLFDIDDGAQVVGEATVADKPMKIALETKWDIDDDEQDFKLITNALAEIGTTKKEIMNLTASVEASWTDDFVRISGGGTNSGDWYPFTAGMDAEISWFDEIAINLIEARIVSEEEMLTSSAGNMTLNTDDLTLKGIFDDYVDSRRCTLDFGIDLDGQSLTGTSECSGAKEYWNLQVGSLLETTTDDELLFTMSIVEAVSEFEMSMGFNQQNVDGLFKFNLTDVILKTEDDSIFNSGVGIIVDTDGQSFEILLWDDGKIDFTTDIRVSWDLPDNQFNLVLSKFFLRFREDTKANIASQLSIDFDNLAVTFELDNLGQYPFDVVTTLRWEVIEVILDEVIAIMVDNFALNWDDGTETIVADGRIEVNIDQSTVGVDLTDLGPRGVVLVSAFSWAQDDEADTFVLQVDEIKMDWDGETKADIGGRFMLDFSKSDSAIASQFSNVVSEPIQTSFTLQDTTALNLDVDMALEFVVDSDEGGFYMLLPAMTIVSEENTRLDTTGTFELDFDSFVTLQVQDVEKFKFDMKQTWNLENDDEDAEDSSFLLELETMTLEVESNPRFDVTGQFEFDSISTGTLDKIVTNFITRNAAGDNKFAFGFDFSILEDSTSSLTVTKVDNLLIEGRSEVIMMNDVMVEFGDVDEDWYMGIGASSAENANLQMNMNVNVTVDVDERVRILMDDMDIAWEGTTLIGDFPVVADIPTSLPTNAPTQAPTSTSTAASSSSTTSAPTGNSTQPPTATETQSSSGTATASPTAAPTSTVAETLLFPDVSMLLRGASQELDDQGKIDFEETLEEYYNEFHQDIILRKLKHLRNEVTRLLEDRVKSFATDVTITRQTVDDNGNTITYDQTITYVPLEGQGVIDKNEAQALFLETPLSSDAQRAEYLNKLKESNSEDFESVASVAAPDVPEAKDDKKDLKEEEESDDGDDKSNALLISLLSVGGVLLCCCAFGAYYVKNSGGRGERSGDDEPKFPQDLDEPFEDKENIENIEDEEDEIGDEESTTDGDGQSENGSFDESDSDDAEEEDDDDTDDDDDENAGAWA